MKHLINTFNELTPEEKADFIKFYTGGDGNLTDEEKRELESGDTTSIICTAFDIWVAKNLDGGKLIDTFVKKAYEFDLADSGYPDSAKERATAKLNAALDIMNAKYFMDIRKKLNPAEEQEYNEILDMARNAKLRDGSWEEYKARKAGKIVPTTFIPQLATAHHEPAKTETPHKISEIVEFMFEMSQVKQETRKNQEYDIKNLLASVNLGLDDDYSKINDPAMINKICEWVKGRKNTNGKDISNRRKNKQLGILRSLVTAANRKEPSQYKLTELTNHILFLRKESKGQTKKYHPFSEKQLADIFDPKHDFFRKNPEQFLACLIALFSGARTNAAITLQFGDITKEDGIDVIGFFENNERKHLKNDATERYVPIAKQLMDWGFVDMIRERQKKIGAKDTDFIFARTQHDISGDPAKKFMTSFFDKFMRGKLNIVSSGRNIYSFHSFRKTISNKLKDLGIEKTIINDICGWEGEGTMEINYSIHQLKELKNAVDKIEYPEDLLHLEEWKKIIPQLYLDRKDAPLKRPKQIQD
ncbi:MAG: tyrosine-type recombinase/integrase [Alphaproteobacteria bacterium]|nr:tyrosine-type recombinase/integrase [Alphaproteobacteria bacterium]